MLNARRLLPAVFATALAVATVAPPSFADNKQVAQQLFDDAKALMEAGKASEACPKLVESMRLDPADGTELRLAYCYELTGRTATAWAMFKTGLGKAKAANNKGRIEFATTRLAAIEPRLSRVTLALDAKQAATGLEVKWDDEVLGAAALGTAFPVDPGAHKLAVSAPGKATFSTTVSIVGDGKQETVKIPVLADAPVAVAHDESTTPTMAYVLLGAGGLFLGGFVVSRIMVGSAQSERQDACLTQHTHSCDDTGSSKVQTWRTVSYVAGGLAAVGLGAGIYFLVKPSKSSTASMGLAPTAGGAAFQLQGTF